MTKTRHISTRVLRLFLAYSIFLVCIFSSCSAFAKEYTFSWSANPEPVSGYKLYYKKGGTAGPPFNGTKADDGPSPIDVGKVTSYTITGLQPNTTYYFALKAYTGTKESGYSAVIAICAPETPSAVINTDKQTGAAPFTVNFDATSSTGPINTYSWSFGDNRSATGSTVSHAYTSSGTYTATLTVQGANGSSDQSSVNIAVAASPPPTYTPPTAKITLDHSTGVAPFTVNFNGSNSNTAQPPIKSYVWNFGDGKSGSGVSIAHLYTKAGTYAVSLTVSDNADQTGQASTSVDIAAPSNKNQPPTPLISLSSVLGVPPLTVSCDASLSTDFDGSITDYMWKFDDDTAAVGSSLQHTFATLGKHRVTLTVIDDQGASTSSTQTVNVVTEEKYRKEIAKIRAGFSNILKMLLRNKH